MTVTAQHDYIRGILENVLLPALYETQEMGSILERKMYLTQFFMQNDALQPHHGRGFFSTLQKSTECLFLSALSSGLIPP